MAACMLISVSLSFSASLCLALRFGIRFPCMSDAYDKQLRQLAHEVGAELGLSHFLKEGVYCVLGGPSFETIAECRMLNRLGADAVGELGGGNNAYYHIIDP